jgi:hypothetical protein
MIYPQAKKKKDDEKEETTDYADYTDFLFFFASLRVSSWLIFTAARHEGCALRPETNENCVINLSNLYYEGCLFL